MLVHMYRCSTEWTGSHGQALRRVRKALGLTQAEVADALSRIGGATFDQPMVSHCERGCAPNDRVDTLLAYVGAHDALVEVPTEEQRPLSIHPKPDPGNEREDFARIVERLQNPTVKELRGQLWASLADRLRTGPNTTDDVAMAQWLWDRAPDLE